MKKREGLNERRAISPVISALILSAVVLTVGGAMWAFSQGAMTISADHYAKSVIDMTDTISERFIIERVAYIDPNLKVWIYNYGTVNIDVKIQVGGVSHPQEWIEVKEGSFVALEPLSYTTSDDEIIIRVYTRRGNNAYYKHLLS